MKTLNLDTLKKVLGNRIFSVTFLKRSDGSVRQLTGRLNVKKHVLGRGAAYNPSEHNLITVFELKTGQYRSIPVDGILELKCGQSSYKLEK